MQGLGLQRLNRKTSCLKWVGARAHAIWASPNQLSHHPSGGGGGGVRAMACDLAPPPSSCLFIILTNNFYPPCLIPKKKSPLHSWRSLVHNPIWNPLHLEGPKLNIYVHFPLVNKQLIGISFLKKVKPKTCKWMSIKHVMKLEATKITKSSLVMYVTYHLKGSFIILEWNFHLVCLFHNNLVMSPTFTSIHTYLN